MKEEAREKVIESITETLREKKVKESTVEGVEEAIGALAEGAKAEIEKNAIEIIIEAMTEKRVKEITIDYIEEEEVIGTLTERAKEEIEENTIEIIVEAMIKKALEKTTTHQGQKENFREESVVARDMRTRVSREVLIMGPLEEEEEIGEAETTTNEICSLYR